jgi:hypothetical protein
MRRCVTKYLGIAVARGALFRPRSTQTSVLSAGASFLIPQSPFVIGASDTIDLFRHYGRISYQPKATSRQPLLRAVTTSSCWHFISIFALHGAKRSSDSPHRTQPEAGSRGGECPDDFLCVIFDALSQLLNAY